MLNDTEDKLNHCGLYLRTGITLNLIRQGEHALQNILIDIFFVNFDEVDNINLRSYQLFKERTVTNFLQSAQSALS